MLEVLLSPMILPWVLIAAGVIFLLVEAVSPGFFMAVPGTALIVLGVLAFFAYDLLSTPFGIVAAVIGAAAAAIVTIFVYRKISPEQKPRTTSTDTIVGKTGLVNTTITHDSISGKVEIDGALWSAKSTGETIVPGKTVRVVSAKGVHITVEEI